MAFHVGPSIPKNELKSLTVTKANKDEMASPKVPKRDPS